MHNSRDLRRDRRGVGVCRRKTNRYAWLGIVRAALTTSVVFIPPTCGVETSEARFANDTAPHPAHRSRHSRWATLPTKWEGYERASCTRLDSEGGGMCGLSRAGSEREEAIQLSVCSVDASLCSQ